MFKPVVKPSLSPQVSPRSHALATSFQCPLPRVTHVLYPSVFALNISVVLSSFIESYAIPIQVSDAGEVRIPAARVTVACDPFGNLAPTHVSHAPQADEEPALAFD